MTVPYLVQGCCGHADIGYTVPAELTNAVRGKVLKIRS
jgi:hypothetical protein